MAKVPKNHGKDWTPPQVKQLKQLAKGNTPTPLIAWKMQRTEPSIRSKAHETGVSLSPRNVSPYGTKKR